MKGHDPDVTEPIDHAPAKPEMLEISFSSLRQRKDLVCFQDFASVAEPQLVTHMDPSEPPADHSLLFRADEGSFRRES